MFPLRTAAAPIQRQCVADSDACADSTPTSPVFRSPSQPTPPPRKSRSGSSVVDLDNGEFSSLGGVEVGGGGAFDAGEALFVDPANAFRTPLPPGHRYIPVPHTQQQQQHYLLQPQQHQQQQNHHQQRRRASFGEFSAEGLLASLKDFSGIETSMDYFPSVETPCNSPTGKMPPPAPPSHLVVRPEVVAQSLLVDGVAFGEHEEEEKLFIDTDDSDED